MKLDCWVCETHLGIPSDTPIAGEQLLGAQSLTSALTGHGIFYKTKCCWVKNSDEFVMYAQRWLPSFVPNQGSWIHTLLMSLGPEIWPTKSYTHDLQRQLVYREFNNVHETILILAIRWVCKQLFKQVATKMHKLIMLFVKYSLSYLSDFFNFRPPFSYKRSALACRYN